MLLFWMVHFHVGLSILKTELYLLKPRALNLPKHKFVIVTVVAHSCINEQRCIILLRGKLKSPAPKRRLFPCGTCDIVFVV